MAYFSGVIRSDILKFDVGLSVFLPYDRPIDEQPFPCKAVYLLHGFGGNHTSWVRNSNVERYAKEHGFALVIPEVSKSFYSDMTFGPKYFTYFTQELPELCSKMFNISSKKEDTFLAGYSMGGYGAIKAALTYPEKYAGCAAFSSLTSIEHVKDAASSLQSEHEVIGLLGNKLEIPSESSLFHLAAQFVTKDIDFLPRIYITCGKQDYLYKDNQVFVKYLDSISLPHTYEEWEGEHNWDFWDTSVRKALKMFATDGN